MDGTVAIRIAEKFVNPFEDDSAKCSALTKYTSIAAQFYLDNNWRAVNIMKKTGKFVYWTPRVLSILFICFLAMFSLDVIQPGLSFGQILIGLIMHNIPAFILIAILAIAWKKEIVGAIGFIGAGLLYIGLMTFNLVNGWPLSRVVISILVIAGPAFLVGILFLMNWRNRKKNIS